MNRAFAYIISAIFLVTPVVFADQETILPTDTVGAPTYSVTSGTYWAAVTDATDGVYVFGDVTGQTVRYKVSNTTQILGGDTIDSVKAYFTSQEQAQPARVRWQWRMMGSANNCEGTNNNLTTSWVEYTEVITGTPNATPGCAGAFSVARVDSLEFTLQATQAASGKESRTTECSLVVFFTPPSEGVEGRRRRGLIGWEIDKTYRLWCVLLSYETPAFRKSEFLWGV